MQATGTLIPPILPVWYSTAGQHAGLQGDEPTGILTLLIPLNKIPGVGAQVLVEAVSLSAGVVSPQAWNQTGPSSLGYRAAV
jgi:hypothetical protein